MAHIWLAFPELEEQDRRQARFYALQGDTVIVHGHRHDDTCVPMDGGHTCHGACARARHWRYQGSEVAEIGPDETRLWLSGTIVTGRRGGAGT